LRTNTLLRQSFARVLSISIRDGCRNQIPECRRCNTTNSRMTGGSVHPGTRLIFFATIHPCVSSIHPLWNAGKFSSHVCTWLNPCQSSSRNPCQSPLIRWYTRWLSISISAGSDKTVISSKVMNPISIITSNYVALLQLITITYFHFQHVGI
jgi:hypothetical protein